MKSFMIFKDIKQGLIVLAAMHISLSLAIGLIGNSTVLQSFHNGRGIWNFAVDSGYYEAHICYLAKILHSRGWLIWLTSPAFIHEKLYSIPYYFIGCSIFSAIFVNTPLYLLTLWLVYQLACSLFNENVGHWAYLIVAFFPSFLLQGTQLLRDSFLIPAQLAFLFGLITLLKENSNWSRILKGAMLGLIGFIGVWTLKGYITPFYILVEILFLIVIAWLGLRKHLFNSRKFFIVLFLIFISAAIGNIDVFFNKYLLTTDDVLYSISLSPPTPTPPLPSARLSDVHPTQISHRPALEPKHLNNPVQPTEPLKLEPVPTNHYTQQKVQIPSVSGPQKRLHKFELTFITIPIDNLVNYSYNMVLAIAQEREHFRLSYPSALSNIDADIALHGLWDIIRYTPRALFIGIAAPFPSMWTERGEQTGRIGRIISGVEMIFMYMAFPFAGVCLWKERRNPSMWPILVFIITGITLHALVITNVGCLYRFRYIYWFLIIILAVRGILPPASESVSTSP
jgi:hypothetical protein